MKTIRGKTAARKLQKDFRAQYPSTIELAFLLQDWDDAYNVGGMFRVADGVGASLMVMTGHTPTPPDPMIGVTSLGHHRRIPHRHFKVHEDAARFLVENGWTLVAVEIAEDSTPYFEYRFPPKTCLVLGNEVNGVYAGVLKHCAAAVHIPMLGKGRSLNVHVAGAVVAYSARFGERQSTQSGNEGQHEGPSVLHEHD